MQAPPPPQPASADPEHLCCPISGALFEQPILLPCCGQVVSRNSIVSWFASRPNETKRCVMCRKDIPDFDPAAAVVVRNVAHEVDEFKRSAAARAAAAPAAAAPAPAQPHVNILRNFSLFFAILCVFLFNHQIDASRSNFSFFSSFLRLLENSIGQPL